MAGDVLHGEKECSEQEKHEVEARAIAESFPRARSYIQQRVNARRALGCFKISI
jgi:hypothetical protein